MPTINHVKKELLLKLVYYGCGFGGKTTNLEHIHRTSRPELRGKLLSLMSETERTLFFDLLPVHLGSFKGYSIRLHLCTVPGQAAFDATRRLVLKGADGIVFVVDSQREAFFDNVASAENLSENLLLQGLDPGTLPLVVQLNKQDLPSAATPEQLCDALDIPAELRVFSAVATEGTGVYETLKEIVCQCLKRVGDPRDLPAGSAPSIIPGRRASMYPEALAEAALQRAVARGTASPPPLPRARPTAASDNTAVDHLTS
jgi:signal recognition particle receptor subunit beta